jgi:transcription elongation factor Elf1
MDSQSGTAGNRFCAKCGAPLVANAGFCGSCGQRVELPETQAAAPTPMPPAPQPPQQFAAQAANVPGVSQQGITCPRCGSTQVQAAKRGWKWTTGMIGSGKMTATCLQCGNKFDLN